MTLSELREELEDVGAYCSELRPVLINVGNDDLELENIIPRTNEDGTSCILLLTKPKETL